MNEVSKIDRGGVLSGGENLTAEITDRRKKGKYPLDRKETIQLGKKCFDEQGHEYTELDVQFTSVMVDLVNDAYAQGFADGRSAMPPKGGVAV